MSKVKSNDKIKKNDANSIIFAQASEAEINKIGELKILGTFEGECADANITNENGMDITAEVWENTFNSDIYSKALEHGWYIGYLGHPEDPDCMEFEHACIVMRECHIEDDGKVYGKFDLIDTPVGRIVKAFTDAGVKFGISVRGVGDLVGNSVDPDTFVFRGFDLVTFPAYPDAIPEFKAIAASTDLENQMKYKKVCAAVDTNLGAIKSCRAIDIIQSQFAPQSEEYIHLETRKREIKGSTDATVDNDLTDITTDKLAGMTDLYLQVVSTNSILAAQIASLKNEKTKCVRDSQRKVKAIKRIVASQLNDIKNDNDKLSRRNTILASQNNRLKSEIEKSTDSNLIYKQKINSQSDELRNKDKIISSLQLDHDETVNAASQLETRSSNLDAKNKELKSEIKACKELIKSYQYAYGKFYANALGVDLNLNTLSINCSTSVDELKHLISGTKSVTSSTNPGIFVEPQEVDIIDELDDYDSDIVAV